MPNILFASNAVSHFPGTVPSSLDWSFDDARVPYSVMPAYLTPATSPPIPVSTTDEWWFHLKMGGNVWYLNSNDPIIEINDASGNRILKLTYKNKEADGYGLYVNVDGGSYSDLRYIPHPYNQTRTYDIQLKFTALTAEFRVYVNEILLITRIVNVGSWLAPDSFMIGGGLGNNNDTNARFYYSEMMVADGDTRNARLDLLRPVAVGAANDWVGPVISLSDDDPTTGMTTILPTQTQSTLLTPYTGAPNISNVVQVTTSVRGVNSPANLKHLIRMGAVNYLTADYSVPFEKAYQITDWRINPATSLPWTEADLVNAEFGFQSAA